MNNFSSTNIRPSGRVVIIGAGMVGATSAYAILIEDVAREILLIDTQKELAAAHVLDLDDAASFSRGTKITNAEYQDLEDGDIIVITAGAAQQPGQSRTELLEVNAKILYSICDSINATGKQLYTLVVSNPVDVLTYLASKRLRQAEDRVFGSGTTLDTARLRAAISDLTNVNPQNVHAFILGEHGDSSFPALSQSVAGGVKLENFPEMDQNKMASLTTQVRDRAYKIIAGKKATYYGIGAAVARICKAIINDEHRVFTLSVPLNGQYGINDVSLGVPVALGSSGYEFIGEIHLNENELTQLHNSAATIKSNILSVTHI